MCVLKWADGYKCCPLHGRFGSLSLWQLFWKVCSDVMGREGETRLALMILWYLDSHEEKGEENLERRIIETMK